MAEMLVRIVDKVNPDSKVLDARCLKRGMVVTIQPDGWEWSDAERKAPYWQIVTVPGASVDDLSAYLAPEPGDAAVNDLLQRRAFKLDVDIAQANAVKSRPTDPTAAAVWELPLQDTIDLKVAVAPLAANADKL
jgi:hypothetical protein